MNNQAGHTLVEFAIGAAIMLLVSSGMFALVGQGLGNSTLWSESSDLHQRARVAAEALQFELSAAGAGVPAGPLTRFLPAVEPRRRGFAASLNAVTFRYVPENAPWSTLSAPLTPDMSLATIAVHSGCPAGSSGCGFAAGSNVVLFDAAGNWDVAAVQGVGTTTLELSNVAGARSSSYGVGAHVVQAVEMTLFLDTAQRQLRREQPGSSALPFIDNVVDLRIAYFGDPLPPTDPVPPPGVANCLFTSSGDAVPGAVLPPDYGGLASLPLSMLTDGPFCGTGAGAYDVDLLRIRTIRVTLRLQTGVDTLRGTEPQLFAQPGSGTVRQRMIPDELVSLDLSPRNLQR
jgi:hypothetical protein